MTQDPITTRAGKAYRKVAGPDADPFDAGARADSTWLGLASGVANVERFCEARSLVAFPAEPATLKAWLMWMIAEEYSCSAIMTYLSAVNIAHELRGLSIDKRPLRQTLRAVRRKAPARRKAAALKAADLRALLKRFDQRRPADCRDASGMLIGFSCGLRQDELANIDWLRPGAGAKGYIGPCRGGYEVTLLRSKTSQEKAHTFTITNRDTPSLRRWLNAWIAHAEVEPGTPLFRPVDRWQRITPLRIRPSAVSDMLRRRLQRLLRADGATPTEAYYQASQFSGHSLRAGMVSETADRGVPLWKMQERSRHKSVEVLVGYIRIAEDKRNSAVKGIKL